MSPTYQKERAPIMIFMGHFIHTTNQEEIEEANRRHGEFNMIVEAPGVEPALRMFRDRIVDYRNNSDFFEGDCMVFLVQLFEFDRFPNQAAMMLNYKSVAGDPLMPFIGCSVPSSDTDACRVFDWSNNNPEVDGEKEKLFIRFDADSSCATASLTEGDA